MNTSSADDGVPADAPGKESEVVSKWIVRIFLFLAFGLAFGIEGMTLVRSYLGYSEEATEQTVEADGGGAAQETIRTGDDLLPATPVVERVQQLRIRARTDGPWAFRFMVVLVNETDGEYRLTLRDLKADDGSAYDESYSIECPPGDSTRLVASWPVGADARPASLTATGELVISADSTQTAERRIFFGHVPVQMKR